MITLGSNPLCAWAKPYYYDLLINECREFIPEEILNHVAQCKNCDAELTQLRAVLSQTEGESSSDQKDANPAVTFMLKLHFAYIDWHVACKTVRPFLPTLVDPALEIKIPTPITAHLDNCGPCRADLEIIQKLNLNRRQLRRLSQLFADQPDRELSVESEMKHLVQSVARMDFGNTTGDALKSLCRSHVCRNLLYKERQEMWESLAPDSQVPEFPCDSVSASDIFDYALLYGLEPANDEYARLQEPLILHLRTCRNCFVKIQELLNTLCGIIERLESGIATTYRISESARVQQPGNLYAGFPIEVEVSGCEHEVQTPQPTSALRLAGALKPKASTINLRTLFKAGAAAAVILIGVMLLLNTPTAKAMTIDQIYKAIAKVKNVHIRRFVPDQTEPIQEKWVSRGLGIYVTKTADELVLWDTSNGVKKVKRAGTDSLETAPLSDSEVASIQHRINSALDILPFSRISEVPEDAQWSRVYDSDLSTTEGADMYDLTWAKQAYDGSDMFSKWRFFVDPETNLPHRTEFYKKLPADSGYTLISLMAVNYLTDLEIRTVIRDATF